MKHNLIFLLFFIFCVNDYSSAQNFCGFDVVHNKRMKGDSVYRNEVARHEASLRKYISLNQKRLYSKSARNKAALYTIPVVVHVMHTGGPVGTVNNPSDEQINGAINYLNQVYNGTYPGTVGAGDIQIQFVLAKRDPDCNNTDGINRIDCSGIPGYNSSGMNFGGSAGGAEETTIKDLSNWDNTRYYNIWLVNKIVGGWGGFAYYPTSYTYDGAVVVSNNMKAGIATLPHELGHAFSLAHPFEGTNGATCPVNNNCSVDGDGICDTDPITQPGSTCRTGINSCTGTSYNINTESNYMNYTSCKTLFTLDQRAKMLAAAAGANRLNLSYSQAGTATNQGSAQCLPKINFTLEEAMLQEKNSQSFNCRNFTDYVYYLTIGNIPTTAATATINSVSGTATRGVDYDLSTNGNFTIQNPVLNFAAGSNAQQPFTVRIYDDAAIESMETFTLSFTVNGGGGNALKGSAGTNLVVTIADNDNSPRADSTIVYDKLDADANFGIVSPFDGSGTTKKKSQIMYKAGEMVKAGIRAGKITGLSLHISKTSSAGAVYSGFTVKLFQTPQRHLRDPSAGNSPLNDLAHTVVYSANVVPVDGWNDIAFTTPFVWDGTSNIVVTFCYSSTTSGSAENTWYYSDSGYTQTVADYVFYKNLDCTTRISAYSFFGSGIKPAIRFTAIDPQTAVQTVVSGKREQTPGNTELFIYDSVQNRLMCRIRNSSAFDYGCTSYQIDRAGVGASPFLDNTPRNYLMTKTAKIEPAVINLSGSFEATFYFTKEEKEGWEAATGQSWNNIKIIKVPGRISDISPAAPRAGDGVEVVTPIRNTLGTHYTLTASFATGFSGFGFGVPSLATVFRFTGSGNWSTSSNWSNGTVPPATLPAGAEIVIDPAAGGECILNVSQTVQPGAKITVLPGRLLKVTGNVNMQ